MARYRGPEEFFEAFKQAARPKGSVPPRAKGAPRPQPTGTASPRKAGEAQPQPPRPAQRQGAENSVTVSYSVLGAASVTVVLLMALAYLLGRGSTSSVAVDEWSAVGDGKGRAIPLEIKQIDPRPGAKRTAEEPRRAPGEAQARETEPQPPAEAERSVYELRLVTYRNSATMRDKAKELITFLNGQEELRRDKATAVIRDAGNSTLVVCLVPFEAMTDARAQRVLKAVQALKYQNRPFTGAAFFKQER
jgi:hypothetical protein